MNLVLKVSLFFFYFLSASTWIYTSNESIVLSMQDMNNQSIRQAKIQTPFILQLELNNKDFVNQEIKYISGMDSFKHSPAMRHSHVSTYNGKTVHKTMYRFVLQGDRKGTFTVGPFLLKDKTGKFIKSNKLVIVVADEIISSVHAQAPRYIVQNQLDKQSVYIGEKTTMSIEFLDRIFVDDYSVALPEFENLKILDVQQKDTTTIQYIDGYDYAVTQWLIEFYPTVVGPLIIDDMKIIFLDQRLEETSLSKGVFRRFGSMMKVEQDLAVKPIKLNVLGLPKEKGFENVSAVGQFSKFIISVNKNSIQLGQGLILTAELFGDGNFEMMDSFALILPKGFQSYDADTVKINNDRSCKHSEFIVQAQEPGAYYIIPQKLRYFDPQDRTYKILESNSLDIIVDVNISMQKNKDESELQVLDEDEFQENYSVKTIEDYKILEFGNVSVQVPIIFALRWYKIYLCFLFLILCILMIYRYFIKKYLANYNQWQHFLLFFQAKKACKFAAYRNNTVVLYSIFIHVFVALKVGTLGAVHEEMIEQYLKDKEFSGEQIMQWKNFYSKLLQASFAQHNQSDTTILFKESLSWLQQLKDRV